MFMACLIDNSISVGWILLPYDRVELADGATVTSPASCINSFLSLESGITSGTSLKWPCEELQFLLFLVGSIYQLQRVATWFPPVSSRS